jgi:hypothetical protein
MKTIYLKVKVRVSKSITRKESKEVAERVAVLLDNNNFYEHPYGKLRLSQVTHHYVSVMKREKVPRCRKPWPPVCVLQ